MKGGDAGRGQGLSYIADAELDDGFVGVFFLVPRYSFGDIGKEVGSLKFVVVFIDFNHSLGLVMIDMAPELKAGPRKTNDDDYRYERNPDLIIKKESSIIKSTLMSILSAIKINPLGTTRHS